MQALQLENVSVNVANALSAQHTVLLENVNASLDAGKILSIIGPNGAGKSTLLKAIAGDLSFSGTIKISGEPDAPKARARQIAVLPQLSLLNFPYRVSEVVALSRIPHSTGRARDAEIVNEALSIMDIDFLADRLYTELSGGEKQRVQLARVFAQIWQAEDTQGGPRLLLLDEPTAALDIGHQHQLMRAIQSFSQQGVATIMVLHDINLASYYSDQMLALLCSQQIAYGSPDTVVNANTIKAMFDVEVTIIKHPSNSTPVVIGL